MTAYQVVPLAYAMHVRDLTSVPRSDLLYAIEHAHAARGIIAVVLKVVAFRFLLTFFNHTLNARKEAFAKRREERHRQNQINVVARQRARSF